MKFILMMLKPYGTGDHDMKNWSAEDRQAHWMFMYTMDRELVASGERIAGEGLASPSQAKIVRAGPDGVPAVTDGPFPESKEFLAGFWIVEVDRPERAYEIAAKASAAPGPGGRPLGLKFEVRQIMTGAPPEA
jgi:hypothetical protein